MASPGLALAPTWKWAPVDLADRKRAIGDTDSEIATLRNAIIAARKQLIALTEGNLNPVQRGLFEAHASLVEDDEVRNEHRSARSSR